VCGIVKTNGVSDRVLAVLSYEKWQTPSLIAFQIVIPPDAGSRMKERLRNSGRATVSIEKHICTINLSHLYRQGIVERRKHESGVFEYRLNKHYEKSRLRYQGRIKLDAYQTGLVIKADYPNTRSFISATKKLVESGVLIPEPDGNFTLNQNIKTERKSNECS